MANRFASISDEEVKEFTEKLENENTKKKTLYDIKVFKNVLTPVTRKGKLKILRPWNCKKSSNKFSLLAEVSHNEAK